MPLRTHLVVTEGLFAFTVKLQETLQLCLLVCVAGLAAEDVVEQLCDGPGDGSKDDHQAKDEWCADSSDRESVPDADLA